MATPGADGQASGIALPIRADHNGSAQLRYGDELITQYVRTYAADWDNDNPFNDDGDLGLAAVFDIAAAAGYKAVARRHIKRMFDFFLARTNLARLVSVSFVHVKEGEVTMEIRYRSIESDEELATSVPLGA